MQFSFTLMDESDVHTLQRWHYEGQYALYNVTADPEDNPSEMLDRRSPYYTVRDAQDELIGFFCFGTSALPYDSGQTGLYSKGRTLAIGLGLRPDLTGKGLGLAFVNAGLTFAKDQFAPTSFHLFVLGFNKRAMCVYERAGFKCVRTFVQRNIHGENEFVEMHRDA